MLITARFGFGPNNAIVTTAELRFGRKLRQFCSISGKLGNMTRPSPAPSRSAPPLPAPLRTISCLSLAFQNKSCFSLRLMAPLVAALCCRAVPRGRRPVDRAERATAAHAKPRRAVRQAVETAASVVAAPPATRSAPSVKRWLWAALRTPKERRSHCA